MGRKNKKKSELSQKPIEQQQQQQQAPPPPAKEQQQQQAPPAKPQEHPSPAESQPQTSRGKKGGQPPLIQQKHPAVLQPQQQQGGQAQPLGPPDNQPLYAQQGPPIGQGQQRPGPPGGRSQQRPQPPGFQEQQRPGPHRGQQRPQPSGFQEQQRPGPPGGRGQQRPQPPGFQEQQRPGPPGGRGQQRPQPPGVQEQQRPGPPGGRGQQRPQPPGFQEQQQLGPPGGRGQQRPQPPGVQEQQQPGPPGGRGQQRPQPPGVQEQQRPGPPGGRGQQRPQPPGFQDQQRPGPSQLRQTPAGNIPTKVDDQVITKGVKGLSLKVPQRKNLKSGGTLGRKTVVETNHLALDLSRVRNERIAHYDVAIDPDKPKRLIRFVMEQFRIENYPDRYPAFDGKKNLYSSGYLPFQFNISNTVNVQDDESKTPKEFKVTINFANMVHLEQLKNYMQAGSSQDAPMEVIQAVDIVLREASASSRSFVQVGRSFFTPPTNQLIDLGNGLELWYGFYQSAILGWRPYVNIDVAHKGFPKNQNVVDLIGELCSCDRRNLTYLNPFQVDDLNKYLRTLKVDYELPNQPNTKRCYKVNSVVGTPRNLEFRLDSGQTITVFDYFRCEKGVMLQYPDLPCLHVGSLNRPNPIFVPVELCTVKSQVIVRKMNELQTQNMIKVAATSADKRKSKIMDALRKAGFNRSKTVQEFGFSVSDQFEKVTARILEPPPLAYHEKTEMPVKGVWRAKHFLTGSELTDWIILNLNGRYTPEDILRSFCTDMKRTGEGLGMIIALARPPCTIECHPRDIQRKLEEYLKFVKGIQLVVVVVPDKGDTYAKVKQTAELQVGVLTQCVKARTMRRMNMSTISNILLKVNSKLNGINHSLLNSAVPPCLKKPVMIVGADVTHPSPDQVDIPSVAAVCASHDPKAFCYNIQYRLQGPREEIIKDLQNIMREHLLFFYNSTSLKPQKIIFYRDGVSEGQFSQVLNEELQAIRRSCQSLEQDYQPKITFLVVQKRHHTRFFPLKREDMDGRNNNVPPGTVVDTDITHPTEMDFYLVSHASIQGTSRPTKYRRLWDDNDMSEDELEQLTYYLCHMFSRCTRAVSYPTPTYYAHLAAYRARVYIEGQKIQLDNLSEEQRRRSIKEVIYKDSPMFFV
ncbi:hypothetical protein PR048_017306 [Dryococelus australis]|uniref:Argonaute 2 n=1 Tax=Dryococelus australis TaxID=614101 RepID=A0ABQ9H986_9NEOP|nr:hypothetical protein PR048_017306 [Dryococelus australis]